MVLVDQNPYYYASIGGILLGIATSLNYCLRGKVTGMSGIVYGIVTINKDQIPEKISIIGGMLLASGIFFDIFQYDSSNKFTPFGPSDQITGNTSYIGYGLAGLLVGFGTKMSNGCTSGHGLCGLPRISIRSLVAVSVFLIAAMAISTLRYYVTLGPFSESSLNPNFEYNHMVSSNICIAVGVLLPFIGGYLKINSSQHNRMRRCELLVDQTITFFVGLIFGFGLLVSGMVRRDNILGFLALGKDWNPSLLFVLGCGILVNLLTFQYMIKVKKLSIFGHDLFNPHNSTIDLRLVGGALCFGLGWGIGGLCPGPAIMQFSVFTLSIHVIWLLFLILGMYIAKALEHHLNEIHKEQVKKQKQLQAQKEHQNREKKHNHHLHEFHDEHTKEDTTQNHFARPHYLPPIKIAVQQSNRIMNSNEIISPPPLQKSIFSNELNSNQALVSQVTS